MARWGRWLVATGATLIMSAAALWAARVAPFSWLPHAEADRWVVAAAFAGIVATAVLAPAAWWAQRALSTDSDHAGDQHASGVRQEALASGHASVTQVGGDQHITGRQQQ